MKLKAKHILVNHEFEAKDLLIKIKEGVAFEDLAKDFSLCPSGVKGGDLGEFSRGTMIPQFEKALLLLKQNEISGVVKSKFGFHIIKRI